MPSFRRKAQTIFGIPLNPSLVGQRKVVLPTPIHDSGNNKLLRMAHPSNGTSSSTSPHYFRERSVAPVRWLPARGLNSYGRYYRSLMYIGLRTSDTLHMK